MYLRPWYTLCCGLYARTDLIGCSTISRVADQVRILNCAVLGSDLLVGPVYNHEVRSDALELLFWSCFFKFFRSLKYCRVRKFPCTLSRGVPYAVGTLGHGTTVTRTIRDACTLFSKKDMVLMTQVRIQQKDLAPEARSGHPRYKATKQHSNNK